MTVLSRSKEIIHLSHDSYFTEEGFKSVSQLDGGLFSHVMAAVDSCVSDFLLCPRPPSGKYTATKVFQVILQRPNDVKRALKFATSPAAFPIVQVVHCDPCVIITEHPYNGFRVVSRGLKILIVFTPIDSALL